MVKTYVILVAGGQGSRMGMAMPKQFLNLAGKPVLYHSLLAFSDALPEATILLVLPAHQLSYAQMVLKEFPERLDVQLVAGGETRFHSVKNALDAIGDFAENDAVMVHDGVRALISKSLILRCHEAILHKDAAVPVVPIADSIRMVKNGTSVTVDREHLRVVQTPQCFKLSALKQAYLQEYQPTFTDDASVAEAFGTTIFLVEGERRNLKITTPEDLIVAEAMMQHSI